MVVLAATAMVAFAPATAMASDTDPLDGIVKSVEKTVGSVDDGLTGSKPKPKAANPAPSVANAPSSDDDSTGHETKDPGTPDHGSGKNIDSDLAGNDVADVGGNDAKVNDDDSTKADSSLLALGGNEVAGAHADSNGQSEDHFGDPLAPVCEESAGAICARLLYSDAYASDDGTTSSSRSESGVVDTCVGGDSTEPGATCSGPVGAEAATSKGEASRDQSSGRTTASSESNTTGVCVARDAVTGDCEVAAGLVESEGQADSGNSPSSADRRSSVAGLVVGDEEFEASEDPQAIAVPTNCETPAALCVFLNQGETYLADSSASHAQEALHVDLLTGTPLAGLVEVSRTETSVSNDGRADVPGDDGGGTGDDGGDNTGGGSGTTDDGGEDGEGSVTAVGNFETNASGDGANSANGANLPNAGGPAALLLVLGLLAVASGAFVTAYGRRRTGALV